MDIQFYGANCISIATKQVRILVDDNLADLGAKTIAKDGDVALFTTIHADPGHVAKLVIDQPGEYEAAGVFIYGIAARGHMDEEGVKTATMYKIVADDINMLVTGHVYPELSDAQLETIGMIDVMVVPVGGHGYTLDAIGALKLIKKIDPKLIIPTHFADEKLAFPVPQETFTEAVKALGMEPKEAVAKLRLKPTELGEGTQLITLERS